MSSAAHEPTPSSGARLAVATAAVLATLVGARPAAAHQASVTYSDLHVSDDARDVAYRLRIAAKDLDEALGVPVDRIATDDEILAGRDRLLAYARERVTLADGTVPCPAGAGRVAVVDDNGHFAELTWTFSCPAPLRELALAYKLFFDVDPNHVGLVQVAYRDASASDQLTIDDVRFTWDLGKPPPSHLGDFIRGGIHHIYSGYDHIAFLLGLLVIAAVTRRDGAWRLRGLRAALGYTAAIVTSFTVAHSMTLIAAALGWLHLPSRFVESMIAASIVFVSVENLARQEPSRRWMLGFGFGLVHGVGFASMLRPLLPPSGVLLPLLTFNVGVEIGQLTIVAVVLPLLYLVARVVGPARYRAAVVVAGSLAVGAFGLLLLIDRVFSLRLINI